VTEGSDVVEIPKDKMVRVKSTVPTWPWESVALSATEQVHGVGGVPVIVPVVESRDRPTGSPVADQVSGRMPLLAEFVSAAIGAFT